MRAATVAWYAGLIAGLLPILAFGFLGSAAANRVVFAAWGAGVAVLYALFLRWGFAAGWSAWLLVGRVALLLAAAAALFGHLVDRYGQDLAPGYRSILPGLYAPALALPRSYYLAAVVLSVLGALQVLIGHGSTRRPPPSPPAPRRLG